MLRRAAVVTFALATLVAACGRQITPDPSGKTNNLSGETVVRVATAGPLDFNTYTYAIALDTCGPGVPYPQAAFTGYLNYSYVFFIGGFAGTAAPELFEYYFNSGNITTLQVNNLNPSTTAFVPNFNNQSTQFQFTFLRADLNNPLNIPQPCPNTTAPPSGQPTAPPQTTWVFNVITFDKNRQPIDSLGLGGATDSSFPGIKVDTTTTNTQTFFRQPGYPSVPAAAQLLSAEVDNYL
ncbi:MAG: hypothetical protein M3R53_05505 [Candidatus Eremiobacteraeota bacterium]|nr:hypothetical protein [Candidatus Eremiobacteraeota bacterium]